VPNASGHGISLLRALRMREPIYISAIVAKTTGFGAFADKGSSSARCDRAFSDCPGFVRAEAALWR
jgi:hypothetical protein